MSEIRNLVLEMGERTLKNLEFIERHAGSGEVYEVTQLWNSLSGLLILPQEREIRTLEEVSLDAAYHLGWPVIDEVRGPSRSWSEQVRRLRNAVAHYNVTLHSKGGDISGVNLWNNPIADQDLPKEKRWLSWEANLSVAVLRQAAVKTSEVWMNGLRLAA